MPPANNNNQRAAVAAASPSFFVGAPLSKIVICTTLLLFVALHSQKAGSMSFHAGRVLVKGEVYRYFSSKVAFGSVGEMVTGTLLLVFLLRKIEREMGSRKCSVFVLFVLLSTIAVEAFFVHSAILSFHLHYAGPYSLLGALFALFHRYTPRLYPQFFSILGFHFSEKVFYYLWFLQVSCAGGWSTALEVVVGGIISLFYQQALQQGKSVDLPNALVAVVSPWAARLIETPPPILVPGGARGGGGARRPQQPPAPHQQQPPLPRAAAVPPAPPPPADPAAVEQLTGMGFSQAQVVQALQSTNNDVQRAADRLLSQQ